MNGLCKLFYEHFTYDPYTGKLHWKKTTTNRVKVGDEVGVIDIKSDGRKYLRTQLKGTKLYVHRIIMAMLYGPFEDWLLVDHRDGNGLNNKPDNLRFADPSLNSVNNRALGVCWAKAQSLWLARMKIRGELLLHEYHRDFHDAVAARKAAEHKYRNLR